MADLKISALTASTTPLAGTEILPIVQSTTTKKVSVENLTAGRAVAAKNLTLTDNTTGEQLTINSSSSGGTSQSFRSTSTNGRNWRVGGNFVIGNGEFSIYDATSSVECFRINASDDIVAPNNNIVIGTSGKGIDFSATSGSGTSELLDDYEEGTWTPTVNGDGGSAGTLAFTSSGTYTKTGRVVTLNGFVSLTNLGSLTGRIGIGGVPFACDVETYFGSFGAANINPTGAATISSWSGAISTNRVHFAITLAAAGGMDSLRFTQLTTSTSLWFTISYITTA